MLTMLQAWRGSGQEWILPKMILSDPLGKQLVGHKQATHVNKKQMKHLKMDKKWHWIYCVNISK